MTRVEQYKKFLKGGELDTLSKHEPAIDEFIAGLFNDSLVFLRKKDEIMRTQKLMETTAVTSSLYNNFNRFFEHDKEVQEGMLAALMAKGFNGERFAQYYGAIMCHMYQTTAERFKINLCTLVDFKKLGVRKPHKKPLGDLLRALKIKYPKNQFIKSLNTLMRNSVTHYTYYFEKGKLHLCNGIFDKKPREMEISDFMKEVKDQSILAEIVVVKLLDGITPGNDLKIER